jgi:hypothetical protein
LGPRQLVPKGGPAKSRDKEREVSCYQAIKEFSVEMIFMLMTDVYIAVFRPILNLLLDEIRQVMITGELKPS